MTRTLYAPHAAIPSEDGGLTVAPALVAIEGDTIVGVTPHPKQVPEDVDHTGAHRLLTPAFVNAHTHLALIALRGLSDDVNGSQNLVEKLFFAVERHLTAEDVEVFTAVGAMECLLSGTAVVWDHYYFADAVLRGLDAVGLKGVVAPTLQDIHGPGASAWEATLELCEQLAADSTLRRRGHALAMGPHATDTVSESLWRRLMEIVERHDLPVHVHLAQSLEEVQRAAAVCGSTPLYRLQEWLPQGNRWILVHGLFLTDADLSSLDPARHTLVICPRAQAQFGFPAHLPGWMDHDVPWVVATDSAAANDGMDVRGELAALSRWRTGGVTLHPEHARWRAHGDVELAGQAWQRRKDDWHRYAQLGDPSSLLGRVWAGPGALHPHQPSGKIQTGHTAHLALWDLEHPSLWPSTDPLRGLALGQSGGALHQLMVGWRLDGNARPRVRNVPPGAGRLEISAARGP